ncbi:MAG TPA: AsmA-like C-terminal region-containing protein, partial [Chitinophagales bacterium]|nr:AsmA-like C-terminal region-containing protein [Chitinophagales bacterium]
EELAALLPREYATYIAHFRSEGNIRFDGSIKGLVSATTKPHVNIEFGVKNATISHDQMKESFKSVNLQGIFSNGTANNRSTSYFNLSNFSTSFDGNSVRGTILLSNFVTPYLNMKLDGELTLEKITPLFPSDYIKELKGAVTFQQFYFKGAVYQLKKASKLDKIEAGGSFNLQDVTIGTDRTTYHHLNGKFDINNNQVMINQLSFNANESDLNFTGSINNFIPYFLNSPSDSSINNQKIGLNIQLSSKSLSWIDLVGVSKNTAPSKTKPAGDYYSIPSLFYVVTGSVSGQIGQFSYDKFNASDVHGKILFLGNTIYFNDFGLRAEKGSVAANGKLDISNMKRNRLELTAKLEKMDITQLFYEFNNFGQSTLTDKNLKGEITSEMALQATWDERVFNKSKLYAIADVSVDNGELNNFDPMMALAKFVKITELKNIRFSKLQNQVEIKNQKIYIPQMQIFTNALNLQLSGTHSFENIIDYKIQLNLLKLLTSKFEKSSANSTEFDKTTEGFLNLYLTMTGPADSPLIKYDKKAVKEKISADLKKEKNELMKVLEKEFYNQEQDQQEIKDWKAPEEIQYMEFEEDTLQSDDEEENSPTITKENQQKELDNFKNIFKPKNPPPK